MTRQSDTRRTSAAAKQGESPPAPSPFSHIKPWSDFADDRLDPRNGLCLSALHDAAFDSGLIALDESLRLILIKRLTAHFPQPMLEQNFVPFAGQTIRLPDKLAEPKRDFLAFHRQSVFVG